MRAQHGEPALTLAEQVSAGMIDYVPFPQALVAKDQCRTEADLTALCASSCDIAFADVETGVRRYAEWLAGWRRARASWRVWVSSFITLAVNTARR